MREAQPSRTALRVALRRAAHQLQDARPLVLDDPLAVRLLSPEHADEIRRTPAAAKRPFSAALRAFVVARARLAEDTLAQAVLELGVRQYLVLGAGLDTFACRNPYAEVRVFEVDHPATQAWKLERLKAAGIAPPATARFVAVDFERDALKSGPRAPGSKPRMPGPGLRALGSELWAKLTAAGFDESAATVTAWLGVVPYLTAEAFRATLHVLAGFQPGSLVMGAGIGQRILDLGGCPITGYNSLYARSFPKILFVNADSVCCVGA